MGTADDRHLSFGGSQSERQEQGLHDQGGGAGGADIEVVLAGHGGRARHEDEARGADFGAFYLGGTDLGGGLDRHKMLRLETGARASGADVVDFHGLSGDRRQREAGADDLPAAFSVGTVDDNRVAHAAACL